MEQKLYDQFGLSEKVIALANQAEQQVKEQFAEVEKRCEVNTLKVLNAFQKNHISEIHFSSTTGYGYSDIGRDTIEKVFAEVLQAEDSLVRSQFISGTHALTVALFAMLRPNDTLLSIAGKPYDTLDEVIGIVPNQSSLKAYGVSYEQIDLLDNDFDYEAIKKRLSQKNVKLVEIQRSRGYALRKSITLDKIKKVIETIRQVNSEVIIMVDNCYGEFVETTEPTQIGADIMVGSLIKNLGGGIAPNGAYIAGKKELVELAAERLTAPGLGKEVGPTLGINKSILQGLFFAPSVVASSLKTAIFASKLLENLGYQVQPRYDEKRSDIVQTIEFGAPEKLIKYCQGIQMGSPIDSQSIPEPWDMPGYTDQVIMAAGAFTQGSSIELSCDGPIRPPYIAFMQGGLTYQYGKLGVMKAVEQIMSK
ncbi:MAG: methionine gamma-lyase family protein [Clostridia bacterium]|nr:methionine gamma-lyase family protein [Clostridia bacterium]